MGGPGGGGGGGGGGFQRRGRSRVDEARDILANVVLCHVPVVSFDYQQKVGGVGLHDAQPLHARTRCARPSLLPWQPPAPRLLQVTYIAVMIRRMLYAMLDPSFIGGLVGAQLCRASAGRAGQRVFLRSSGGRGCWTAAIGWAHVTCTYVPQPSPLKRT